MPMYQKIIIVTFNSENIEVYIHFKSYHPALREAELLIFFLNLGKMCANPNTHKMSDHADPQCVLFTLARTNQNKNRKQPGTQSWWMSVWTVCVESASLQSWGQRSEQRGGSPHASSGCCPGSCFHTSRHGRRCDLPSCQRTRWDLDLLLAWKREVSVLLMSF